MARQNDQRKLAEWQQRLRRFEKSGLTMTDRSANGTSASVGRAARTMRSNSRDWPGWMRRSLRGAEELPIHAQSRVFLVGSSPP